MIERPTPHVIRRMGWRRQRPDVRDRKFKAQRMKLPREVDLRRNGPPIMNQGNIGSCVAFATTRGMRHAIRNMGFADMMLSCLQLYADARLLEGTSLMEDSGLEIRDALKCAAKLGVAHDSVWPYSDDAVTFTKMPPQSVYDDALFNQTLLYEAVNVDVQSVQAALASGVPVIFGVMLYSSFWNVGADGLVPIPNPTRERQEGGHAMLVEGYRADGKFIVANSWGMGWGQNGYCYFPSQYLASNSFADDFWIVRVTEGFADSDMAKKLRDWIDNPQVAAI